MRIVSRAASIEPVASATRLWMVANSAMRLLPPATAPRVVRTLAMSMKSASAPSAMPRIGATSVNGSGGEHRLPVQRIVVDRRAGRRPGQQIGDRHNAMGRHEHIVGDGVLAAGAGEPHGEPVVVERDVGARQQEERRAWRRAFARPAGSCRRGTATARDRSRW